MARYRRPARARIVRRKHLPAVVLLVIGLESLVVAAIPFQQQPNPLAGRRLFIDPASAAKRQAESLRRSKPQDAELLSRIADQPVARWMGGWVGDIGREVDNAVSIITKSGTAGISVKPANQTRAGVLALDVDEYVGVHEFH